MVMSPGLGSDRSLSLVPSSSIRALTHRMIRTLSSSRVSPSVPGVSSFSANRTCTSAFAYIGARSFIISSIFPATASASSSTPLNSGLVPAPSRMIRPASSDGVPLRQSTTPLRRCIQFAFFLTTPPPVATTHFLYAATSASTAVSISRKPSSPFSAKISGMVVLVTCSMTSSLVGWVGGARVVGQGTDGVEALFG